MNKFFAGILIILAAIFFFFIARNHMTGENIPTKEQGADATIQKNSSDTDNQPTDQSIQKNSGSNVFQPPLDRAGERVTKKPFGIFITPQNSPAQPEKFRGYHTGTDFEIFPEELGADVPVRAICSGTIAVKRSAGGYGGVLVQNCTLDNLPVTVIYGHLKLASIQKNAGENLNAGDTIGILGKAYSAETSGERKHLHLGIHKEASVNILGYVGSQSQLSGWLDACLYVCK